MRVVRVSQRKSLPHKKKTTTHKTHCKFEKTGRAENVVVVFCPPLSLWFCHILFFGLGRNPTQSISSNINVNKKKVILLFKKLEMYERASFCVSSALFIYLKGCTLYQFTLPHSLRHRLQRSEVKRINYFFLLLFIK